MSQCNNNVSNVSAVNGRRELELQFNILVERLLAPHEPGKALDQWDLHDKLFWKKLIRLTVAVKGALPAGILDDAQKPTYPIEKPPPSLLLLDTLFWKKAAYLETVLKTKVPQTLLDDAQKPTYPIEKPPPSLVQFQSLLSNPLPQALFAEDSLKATELSERPQALLMLNKLFWKKLAGLMAAVKGALPTEFVAEAQKPTYPIEKPPPSLTLDTVFWEQVADLEAGLRNRLPQTFLLDGSRKTYALAQISTRMLAEDGRTAASAAPTS
jgi:hypothetical protein